LLLRKEGVNFRTTAEFEIVRTIKEKACYLANNPQKEETVETEKYQYTLPDGSMLEVWPFFSVYFSRLFTKTYVIKSFQGIPFGQFHAKNPKCLMLVERGQFPMIVMCAM